ncbi:LOW QUALITY PROTEIN: hypothetical protein HID58_034218, partial [Brassica napus]
MLVVACYLLDMGPPFPSSLFFVIANCTNFGGWLVLGLGSSNGIITKECSLFLMVSSPLVAVTGLSGRFMYRFLDPHHHLMLPSSSNNPVSLRFSLTDWSCVDCSGVFSWTLLWSVYPLVRPFTTVCCLFTTLRSYTFVIFNSLMKLCKTFQGFAYRYFMSVFFLYGICSPSFITYFKLFCFKKDISVIEVLIKGLSKWCSIAYMCVAISRIVNCALAAVLVSRIISLSMIFNSQASFHFAAWLMTLLSCSLNTFSFNGVRIYKT